MARNALDDGASDPGYSVALATSLRDGPLRDRLLNVAELRSRRLGQADEYGLVIQELRKDSRRKMAREQQELIDDPEQAIKAFDRVVARFGDPTEPALREQVAKALFYKGITLGQLGRPEQEIEVYDSVVARFGDATEPALRERVAKALVNKGITLGQLGRYGEAESAYRRAIALNVDAVQPWNRLGNLLLDRVGDVVAALAAYEGGLAADSEGSTQAMLHANCAYALALHGGDAVLAHEHVQQALADGTSISAAGRSLLEALPYLGALSAARWPMVFEQIGKAVDSGDPALWSSYLDDLQRLLWFELAHGEGDSLRRWMDKAQYPMRYAPLYHALVAAIEGDDHLLRINPETRQPAAPIYEGIRRRLTLYAKKGRN